MESAFDRSRSVDVGPVKAHVAEAGDGPPIVLLHGNPDTHDVWEGVVRELAPRHHCFAPDLPGFGASTAPEDFDCSLENQAAFVVGVLDGLGLAKTHLVVHDIGGPYGLAFATLHPDRVQSLSIFNTSFFPETEWHFWARVWRTSVLGELAMLVMNRPLFVREMTRGSPNLPRAYAERAYAHITARTKRMVLRWYRAMDYPVVMRGWDERMLAATAKVPKQVLWGERDRFIPVSMADRYAATVHRYPDAGHWVMLESPKSAAERIAALVAGA